MDDDNETSAERSLSGGTIFEEGLNAVANSTPEQFANMEAAEELNRERWHQRLARIFRRRSS
jgi:hypothetical protein